MNKDETNAEPVPASSKTRPKFTIDYLKHPILGLDEVYENFQGYFGAKERGQGSEGRDLSDLLSLYENWQRKLFPYCTFEAFVQKVERIGRTREGQELIGQYRQRTIAAMMPIENLTLEENEEKDTEMDDVLDSLGL